MIFYIAGLCIYSIFDFIELPGKSKTHEKILFIVIFSLALALGIWYFSTEVNLYTSIKQIKLINLA